MEPEVLASVLAKAALEKKARDLVILDLRKHIDYADVFILCSAGNRRQVQAIADAVRRIAKDNGLRAIGVEGLEAARWVLADFGSVVVHVFDEPMRTFYNLDGLWADAPRLAPPELPDAPADAADEDDGDWA